MMTMVSLIADQVRNKQELFDDEGEIMQALLNNGYRLHEADAALTLMQSLVQKQSEGLIPASPSVSRAGMRAMNREERHRFTIDAFGFVMKLTSLGMISEDQREDLLDRATTIFAERIDLGHIKNLVAFTLFFSHQEQDMDVPEVSRRIRNTSWN
jgi:Smg protein